jgi:2-methylcitrate dehydratase PrpD
MTQPFIDCAIALAQSGVQADDIVSMVCETAEGYVHRLWEPLASKQSPANGYAGKFSVPYCIAAGFIDGKAGFEQFTDARVSDPALRALAAKVSYVVNPNDPYPKNFTGHIRATLEERQRTRGAQAAHARWRPRTAVGSRHFGQVLRQCALRWLAAREGGSVSPRRWIGLPRAAPQI